MATPDDRREKIHEIEITLAKNKKVIAGNKEISQLGQKNNKYFEIVIRKFVKKINIDKN